MRVKERFAELAKVNLDEHLTKNKAPDPIEHGEGLGLKHEMTLRFVVIFLPRPQLLRQTAWWHSTTHQTYKS